MNDGDIKQLVFGIRWSSKQTCSAAGERKHDDVIVGPRVVLVRRVESQCLHALFP